MTLKQGKDNEPVCRCDTCCKEIPRSSATTAEGKDYVWHFCGKECYTKWHSQSQRQDDNHS